MRPVVVGTAGHIDHGKTALVRRLTGIDTDRLPEERERGISIDLGFAHLVLPSGRRIAIVDVPGHERFVKNMLAGATGIDLLLLVVAADEGVMPQTREHLAIVDLLGVRHGVVALTKSDLASPEMARLAREDVLDINDPDKCFQLMHRRSDVNRCYGNRYLTRRPFRPEQCQLVRSLQQR